MSEEKTVGQVCLGWWGRWIDGDDGKARAARARLRRPGSVIEAVMIPAVQELNRQLAGQGHDLRQRPDRLVLIAAALAACRHSPGRRAASVFGTPHDQPAVSALRFTGLVRETDPDRLRQPLVRALGQVRGQVDAARLAADLLHWSEAVRTRWAFEYYGAAAPEPEPESETEA